MRSNKAPQSRQPMRYFTIGEFVRSAKADEYGINNRLPSMKESDNIYRLVKNVLDPLRQAYGKPIYVSSGYRCPRLNAIVGGSPTSDHMTGCAADIQGTPRTPAESRRLFSLIQELGLPFDQLIDEKDMSWVHVSHREKGNRGQVMKL
jgi:hypothetical protein